MNMYYHLVSFSFLFFFSILETILNKKKEHYTWSSNSAMESRKFFLATTGPQIFLGIYASAYLTFHPLLEGVLA